MKDVLLKRSLQMVVLLGFVSLFADITYEGARGILGPFLFMLGASATAVGFVSGLGELTGYALRLFSGFISDKTRKYWTITIFGYFLTLVSVPLLAFAGRWEIASALIIIERFGKALRTPARDTLISYASSNIGYGKGFALHEALDQIGAIAGPLLVAGVLHFTKSYPNAFLSLGIPSLLSLSALVYARIIFPNPEKLERESIAQQSKKLDKIFYIYIVFVSLTIAGYPHFQIISYHFKKEGIFSDELIPVLFAIAMGADAISALIIGNLFDKFKIKLLTLIPLFSIVVPFLSFAENKIFAFGGTLIWGIVMGLQETIMKSAIAELVPSEKRGTAFGIFHALFGIAWFAGSVILGRLYEISINHLIAFCVALQIISIFVFLLMKR